jgi:hypothetical protein
MLSFINAYRHNFFQHSALSLRDITCIVKQLNVRRMHVLVRQNMQQLRSLLSEHFFPDFQVPLLSEPKYFGGGDIVGYKLPCD